MHLIKVPFSLPRTKPKALNYAMQYCKGKYVVIYDAEDRPAFDQLLKAVIEFDRLPEEYVCLQAKLTFYNENENLLTKLFNIEYCIWFEYLLTGLSLMSLPVLLGGTSNHFKLDILQKVGFWDAYNVTEDADLGIRLSSFNYKVWILDSYTYEESPIDIMSWINQRSRWIKGFLQTFLVFLPSYMHLIKVPFSLPRTKPKALNYAMQYCKGKYVVIYDAEDRPAFDQLLKAVIEFDRLPEEYVCLQAKLTFYNENENLLTKLFNIEYCIWFEYLLTGLSLMSLPVLLGGTSNHFKLDILQKVGFWDAYNVTEDADLVELDTIAKVISSLNWLDQYLAKARRANKSIISAFHDSSEHFVVDGGARRFKEMLEKPQASAIFVRHYHGNTG
ncbi:unnamed protein product [Didymodactylos carnosus]|uniref:Glycosyltransferase 2-like domain-containing protein n=1 Tax=Didymodactylos carnosus TaxID=1234261 RepID=A0A815ZAX7_9BILA|nr:unnamed protein product [Didymodactylos carnosus]CAF4447572.1 unnamed protein product [Didymodactylos carnosus]